mgnify:CR=1 FL=1
MYQALPSSLHIKDSPVAGQGIFAKEDIPADLELGVSHVVVDEDIMRTPIGGFVNHSDKPNCMIVIDQAFTHLYFLFTTEQIMPGEELTVKYNTYNPEEE